MNQINPRLKKLKQREIQIKRQLKVASLDSVMILAKKLYELKKEIERLEKQNK